MRILVSFLSFLLVCSVASAAKPKASDTQANDYLNKLQEAWDNAKTYQADFKQVVSDKRLGTRDETKGVLSVIKPDKLRWDSKSDKALQILNGKKLTNVHYNKRRDRYTVDVFANASKSVDNKSLRILAGTVRFKELYRPEIVADKDKSVELKLIPKASGDETLIAEIDKSSYFLRALITDSRDSRVVVEFSNTKTNLDLEEKLFSYKPGPKDVVHENP